jgi:hypothetical protein
MDKPGISTISIPIPGALATSGPDLLAEQPIRLAHHPQRDLKEQSQHLVPTHATQRDSEPTKRVGAIDSGRDQYAASAEIPLDECEEKQDLLGTRRGRIDFSPQSR